eukprot:CAMPEP_0115843370 /NCGR_PEP_ID=MMETSP0287-20121206/8278_1 /TAXON_ID=412157 /ORGANISM="Chrysochromulina rotalis, Strain UIO044" /LENGTH=240 /DNA_ID=CAMNT_0003297063 /DNA_START=15 /DNA_END=738 /DNA_ORIENTATION=+
MAARLLLVCTATASALRLPTPDADGAISRRSIVGSTLAAAAASAAVAASVPLAALAEDKVVPKSKVGVTPGGVKYFDKEPGSCSPFNPCIPQQGDIVKIKVLRQNQPGVLLPCCAASTLLATGDRPDLACALFRFVSYTLSADKAYLSNGKMFDSSDGPGRKPLAAKYKASPPQLLPGWEEALETMEQGGTRIIQVPPEMAYGDKGVKVETKDGGSEYLVPPGEKLQFELTLVQVALPPP